MFLVGAPLLDLVEGQRLRRRASLPAGDDAARVDRSRIILDLELPSSLALLPGTSCSSRTGT